MVQYSHQLSGATRVRMGTQTIREKKMKTVLAAIFLVMSSSLAFGQSIDDLVKRVGGALISSGQARGERDKLSRSASKYNADQPSVQLAGARAVVRPPDEYQSYGDRRQRWLKSSINGIATSIGCRPVWDDRAIDEESASRAHHRKNDEVDQTTLPGKGKIKYRSVILEFEFIDFEKYHDSEIALGRWWNQSRLRMSRETAYFGLTLTITDGDTGETLAVYKTLGIASSADNVGAQLGGFFSNPISYSSSGRSEDDRQFRAMENALREMGSVLRQKC